MFSLLRSMFDQDLYNGYADLLYYWHSWTTTADNNTTTATTTAVNNTVSTAFVEKKIPLRHVIKLLKQQLPPFIVRYIVLYYGQPQDHSSETLHQRIQQHLTSITNEQFLLAHSTSITWPLLKEAVLFNDVHLASQLALALQRLPNNHEHFISLFVDECHSQEMATMFTDFVLSETDMWDSEQNQYPLLYAILCNLLDLPDYKFTTICHVLGRTHRTKQRLVATLVRVFRTCKDPSSQVHTTRLGIILDACKNEQQ